MDIILFDWQDILQKYGPILGVIGFFIWRDWRRETRLSNRLEKLEDYQRETLAHLVEKGTAALVQSSEVIKWVGRVIEHVSTKCPCVNYPRQKMPTP